ncbi:MAG: L,D-transpeptidase family protein [bacterium]|nr:L,D-transpeptidase family protein [bacterium]
MTAPRNKTSLFLTACAAIALLCAAATTDAAMPVPQRKAEKSAGAKPVKPKAAKPAAVKSKMPDSDADMGTGEKALPAQDVDENLPLPPYPRAARTATGEMKTYALNEEDTFIDVARAYRLGYVELRAANPELDPWSPDPGSVMVIPTFKLLPRARQEGIVVNLGEMRMYYFRGAGLPPLSFPLGIGREGLETPLGDTSIVRKAAGPSWHPTDRMKKEKPWLPGTVSPGASNPLGTHAMYLGWPTFLIHGSNKPWGIGRRVSSGCMRMYPEDIINMFNMTPIGTRVQVVNQPIKTAWVGDNLYLEANPSMTQSGEIEIDGTHTIKPMGDGLRETIVQTAGDAAGRVDWSTVNRVIRERRGYPVLIATTGREIVSDRSGRNDGDDSRSDNSDNSQTRDRPKQKYN